MRSIDLRVPAVAGFAVLLLAFAPGAKAAEAQNIQFVAGTGEASTAAPIALAKNTDDSRDAEAKLSEMAEDLADPRVQNGVAAMVERMGETLLDLPVGKFAAAVENARPGTIEKPIREDATVADLAGRDTERLPRKLGKGSRQMMTMLSGFASAFATMVPEFEAMGRDLERSMKDIKAARD
ncbi:MAG TPA: hypothetical protein PKC48_06230 [Sphingorhabdus sp.]|jgi:uncharacterized protein with ATP-grasp and redox domains|uniref:hypothetical protein n=1 Tax=Sphingorhabdus sp. TaxID=1902408 RepID=UPI002C3EE5DE|nr:hypothetical protein [Sphingorhabdus sp.]HMT40376.1 hypothetical protein [Sphingorhabdus sp.]HMU21866.1 hypothetical protein [Sphingorhabdus sp.]